jgi:Carboxypeptidase regulatory-like domain
MFSLMKLSPTKLSSNHFVRASLLYFALSAVAPLLFLTRASGQNPAQASSQDAPPAPSQSPSSSSESSSKPKSAAPASRHSDDFLIRGTVFTEEGLALPGAQMRIRRTAEKKPHWETVSNSRGDFAVRVKMGTAYEVTVRAKGFQEQTLPVNAATGDRFKDLVFRLQREGGKKT